MPARVIRWFSAALLLGAGLTACALTETSETTTTTTAAPTSTLSPTTTEDDSSTRLRRQIEELIAAAELARELRFLEEPTVTLVSDEELARRVREQIEEELDPEEVARDQELLVLLGLLPPDMDLAELYLDLYEEQVAGFYDGDTRELVVPARAAELSPLQKVTLVHELVHALTDQHFDFHERSTQLDDEERFDELSAFHALIEGDATHAEFRYLLGLPMAEQRRILFESLSQDQAVFEATPGFLQDLLLFPYLEGNRFVEYIVDRQGYGAVDAAYQQPPRSTEHIYRPGTFGAEEVRVVTLPATSLPGYETGEESVWGVLGFDLMFRRTLPTSIAQDAIEGWGGDTYRVLWDGEQVVFVVLFQGDAVRDAEELHTALREYVPAQMAVGAGARDGSGRRYESADYAFVSRNGDRVLFVAAGDPEAGAAVRALFPDF